MNLLKEGAAGSILQCICKKWLPAYFGLMHIFLLFLANPSPLARCRALHLGLVTEVLTELLTESQS